MCIPVPWDAEAFHPGTATSLLLLFTFPFFLLCVIVLPLSSHILFNLTAPWDRVDIRVHGVLRD